MTLKQEKERFQLVAKRILKEKLSNNQETLLGYKNSIISVYNESVTYIVSNFNKVDEKSKQQYKAYVEYIRNRFLQCLNKLQFSYEFNDDLFQLIKPEDVIVLEDIDVTVYENTVTLEDDFKNFEETRNETNNMPDEEKSKFINTYSKLLPEYDGKFENLQRFIDACELMDDGVGNHMGVAVRLIKAKLGVSARSFITNEDTIKKILDKLRGSIKADSSKVVSAKLMSLKQGNKSPNDFMKEVEEMTELLNVAYINEGMPPALAESQSVDYAARSLIANVSNPQIKTVLQSADLKTVNDISTKYLSVATDQATNKAQVFYNKRFNKRGYRGRGRKYFNNNNSFRGGYGNGSYRGNNRGRGNFRGNRGNNRGNYGNGNPAIRYTENCQYPQLTLGGESNMSTS